MSQETRKRALRAAAKVVLSLSLSGCSSLHEPTQPTVDAAADARSVDHDSGPSHDAGYDAGEDAAIALIDAGADALIDAGLDCVDVFTRVLDGRLANPTDGGSPYADFSASEAEEPGVHVCCAGVAADFSTSAGPSDELRRPCCRLVLGEEHEFDSAGCSPWGPPVPPNMGVA